MYNSDFQKRRVVIYARVSTEHEAQISALENQIDWYKPIMAARPEWELVNQYIDEGITGTSAEKRPQFMKMIDDAKAHKFDLILTREVSRFARNTVDTLQYTRLLKDYKIEVFFINDNIKTFDGDGELRLTIMATLAQDESRKTSVRVKSGQQTSMNNGVVYGNGNILGYRREGKEMVIDPEQAKTVRLIFDLYLDGYGLVKIKYELEKRGILTSSGKSQWSPTVISGVLKNTFYYGYMTYHKEFVPDYLKQKKIKNYGELEHTITKGNHEPIVTKEEFERVQHIMESKKTQCKNLNTGRRTTGKLPVTTVWGKLLVCSCGQHFNRRVWDHKNNHLNAAYQCYSSVNNGSYKTRLNKGLPVDGVCRVPMIPEWKLQMTANMILKNYLRNTDKVLELANSMLEAHIADKEETDKTEEQLKEKAEELDRLNKKMDNYVEMRSGGEITKEIFKRKCDELQPKIECISKEIIELKHKLEPVELTVNYEEKLSVLRYALEQYTTLDREEDVPPCIIEAFVSKIVAYPDRLDWYLRFDGDPNDPLQCIVSGKRKNSANIEIKEGKTPAEHQCCTGSTQRLRVNPYKSSRGFLRIHGIFSVN